MKNLVIVGTGGMGREALAWARDLHGPDAVAGFVDDAPTAGHVAGLPVLGDVAWLIGGQQMVVVAIGDCRQRANVIEQLGDDRCATLVHPTAYLGPDVEIGGGALICPGVTITRDVVIGRGTIVNYGAAIGHDTNVGSACFIGPGATLGGGVVIGDEVWVGIGASVIQGIRIGSGTTVGAGASVVSDLPADVTAVGVPCRPVGPAT